MTTQFFHYDYTEKLSLVLSKARQGKPIKIGFLGGSITQGCNPSIPENAYAVKVYEWLKSYLAPSEVSYINGGIGATGSLIGVHRMQEDLLQFEPDIIIVEFAANDVPPTPSTRESYESLVRRTLETLPNVAVIELFMTLQDGTSAEAQQTQIGHHYKVPMVSFRQEIFNGIGAGKYTWEDIETDEVHPNDKGHAIVAKLLQNLFKYAGNKEVDENYVYQLPEEVLFSKRYTDGMILNHHHLKPLFLGAFEESEEGFKTLKDGWTVKISENNKAFVCKIEAKRIFLLYRRNLGANKGTAKIKVNYEVALEVDSSFDKGWGDYAETVLLVDGDEVREHIIEIQLKKDYPEATFTILGFLVSKE